MHYVFMGAASDAHSFAQDKKAELDFSSLNLGPVEAQEIAGAKPSACCVRPFCRCLEQEGVSDSRARALLQRY